MVSRPGSPPYRMTFVPASVHNYACPAETEGFRFCRSAGGRERVVSGASCPLMTTYPRPAREGHRHWVPMVALRHRAAGGDEPASLQSAVCGSGNTGSRYGCWPGRW
jgi:hypothetical protein